MVMYIKYNYNILFHNFKRIIVYNNHILVIFIILDIKLNVFPRRVQCEIQKIVNKIYYLDISIFTAYRTQVRIHDIT